LSSISRFPVPDLESLPDDLRATIEEVAAKTGFVPNAYLNIAHRPDEWRAFFAYYAALMEGDEGLSKAERELIVVATSAVNDCTYCVVAHGALARLQSKNPIVADQVAVDWRKADLTPREHAIVEFAVKLAGTPAEVGDEDIERLRTGGLSEDEIWQVGAITAFFAMSNRLAHFTATPPNPEFHLMGRVPRATYEELVKPAPAKP
jgi:uncharacterized peroxidase-related enzyme